MTETTSSATLTLEGGCHCGEIRFRAVLPTGLASPRRCTCSMCGMRGAVAVSAELESFEVTKGADKLATYRFSTHTAEDHFCSRCGIYTHHKRRSNPNELGVNAACLDGISPFDFSEVLVNDGQRHPSDNPTGQTTVAGTLTFTPAN